VMSIYMLDNGLTPLATMANQLPHSHLDPRRLLHSDCGDQLGSGAATTGVIPTSPGAGVRTAKFPPIYSSGPKTHKQYNDIVYSIKIYNSKSQ